MLLASRKEDERVRVGELAYDVAEYENLKEERAPRRVIMADPEFQEVIKSEQTDKTVEKIDIVYMRPTDFSPMK